jgi:hypothetical protein
VRSPGKSRRLAVEYQAVFGLGGSRRRGGRFANIERDSQLAARFQVAPVHPEILVQQGQRQEAAPLDTDSLTVFDTEQIHSALASARDRVVWQRFDARSEGTDQADEASADQDRLSGAYHRLVERGPLVETERC